MRFYVVALITFGGSGPASTAHGSLDVKQEIEWNWMLRSCRYWCGYEKRQCFLCLKTCRPLWKIACCKSFIIIIIVIIIFNRTFIYYFFLMTCGIGLLLQHAPHSHFVKIILTCTFVISLDRIPSDVVNSFYNIDYSVCIPGCQFVTVEFAVIYLFICLFILFFFLECMNFVVKSDWLNSKK
jgi:hypothetical protein